MRNRMDENRRSEKAAEVTVYLQEKNDENLAVAKKVKDVIEAAEDLKGEKITLVMGAKHAQEFRMQVRMDTGIIVYNRNAKETPEIRHGMSVRTYMLPYESERRFAKRVCTDIINVMNWQKEEHFVNIWNSDIRVPSEKEKELKRFLEESLKASNMSGYSLKADFSVLEDDTTELSCPILFRVYDHVGDVGGRVNYSMLFCYSDDEEWMRNINTTFKISKRATSTNYCENMNEVKAAIKRNLEEAENYLKEARISGYMRQLNLYKECALQEYVDKKIVSEGLAVKVYADVDILTENDCERVCIDYGSRSDERIQETVIICKDKQDAKYLQETNNDLRVKITFEPSDGLLTGAVDAVLDRACRFVPQVNALGWVKYLKQSKDWRPYVQVDDSPDDIDFTFFIE